jgi:hypothetical protein
MSDTKTKQLEFWEQFKEFSAEKYPQLQVAFTKNLGTGLMFPLVGLIVMCV